MTLESTISALLARQKPGFSLDQAFYRDDDIYRLDLEEFWYRDWLFAGHDCEIAQPGSFFTVQVGDYSVIVVRGRDGVIRAFHNVCRHRDRDLPDGEGAGVPARLPLSSVDL